MAFKRSAVRFRLAPPYIKIKVTFAQTALSCNKLHKDYLGIKIILNTHANHIAKKMTQENKYTLEHCIYSDSLLNKLEKLNNNNQIQYKNEQVNIDFIKKGISFAKYYHGQQMRKSGEPYYSHPIIVAGMVADHIFKNDAIIGALLHDTLEDTTLTLSEIESEFNPRIAEMVDRLTRKIDPATGKKMSAGECLVKLINIDDKESVLIKMIDRIHNVMTIDSMSKEKQEKIIQETIHEFFVLAMQNKNSDIELILEKIILSYKEKNKRITNSQNYLLQASENDEAPNSILSKLE
jgi:guanosine-3',5'-bis(diphosphate) 3'-pyrophosphohydrolase